MPNETVAMCEEVQQNTTSMNQIFHLLSVWDEPSVLVTSLQLHLLKYKFGFHVSKLHFVLFCFYHTLFYLEQLRFGPAGGNDERDVHH